MPDQVAGKEFNRQLAISTALPEAECRQSGCSLLSLVKFIFGGSFNIKENILKVRIIRWHQFMRSR